MPYVKTYYSIICDHPYFEEFDIAVEPLQRAGMVRNTYTLKARNPQEGHETEVEYRFSTGQLNCVALAVFLAMAKAGVAEHGLDFIILDDPSQNLDPEHKKPLAELIRQVAESRQILVSTQDPEFADYLMDTVPKGALQRYRFGRWQSPGPVFQRIE